MENDKTEAALTTLNQKLHSSQKALRTLLIDYCETLPNAFRRDANAKPNTDHSAAHTIAIHCLKAMLSDCRVAYFAGLADPEKRTQIEGLIPREKLKECPDAEEKFQTYWDSLKTALTTWARPHYDYCASNRLKSETHRIEATIMANLSSLLRDTKCYTPLIDGFDNEIAQRIKKIEAIQMTRTATEGMTP